MMTGYLVGGIWDGALVLYILGLVLIAGVIISAVLIDRLERRRWLGQVKRKLRFSWSCSDYTHHQHRYRWTAWLCGRVQAVGAMFGVYP